MRLSIVDVRVDLGGRVVVGGATLLVEPGEVAGLVGPNGAGKSSLLRAVYRHLRPAAGEVRADDADLWRLPPREVARRVAAVPQETRTDFDVTVSDLVAMGRTPYKRPFAADSATDRAAVADALDRVGMAGFADRRFATLSGGERQRVVVARALAQRTPVLALDEPVNHLDVRHQLELLELIRAVRLTTLIVLHDLNLAAAYCDRVHVLDGGRLVASGRSEDVLTPALLRTVFGVHADVLSHPRTGRPLLVFSPVGAA